MFRLFGQPPSLRRALRAADDYNIDPVMHEWFLFKHTTYDVVILHEVELKRFLVMRGCFPKQDYLPYGDILLLWQVFVLHTARYADFCNRCVGTFIHFDPISTDHGKRIPRSYADFYEDYKIRFRQEPDPTIWPDPNVMPMDESIFPLARHRKKIISGEMVRPHTKP